MKFGMLLDKTKVKSNYFKSGKSFNYFNNEPYIRNHSISNECQLGFWSYPSLFDGKLLNLNEFDKLPDEEFDLIFINLESSNSKFTIDEIKNKYKCKIFGIFKEAYDIDYNTYNYTFSKCDKIVTGVQVQMNDLKSKFNEKVFYLPQPVNIDYLRNNFYVKLKDNSLFCYTSHVDRRSSLNLKLSEQLCTKYNLNLKINDAKNNYLNLFDFLKIISTSKYHVNLDTDYLTVGQQACLCACLGIINLGGNNDATYNLYPETYGLDFTKCEKFLKYCLSSEKNREEYEQIVLDRLSCIYNYDVVKNQILNLI
jgi:hypothetical protein